MSERRKGDEGFFMRGKYWWCRTDPVTGEQASTKAKTRAQRDAWYDLRYRQSLDPEYQPKATEDTGLNYWAVKFVEHKRATKSAATAKFYTDKLGHIVRIFGASTPIGNALRPSQFDRYMVQRKEEGARPTTVMKEVRAAQTLARFAARAGAFHGRPELFRPSELSDDYEPGERFLTFEELVRLMTLGRLPEKRMADVCMRIAIGSRYSELYRVQPSDVDTERWVVHVPGTKTKRARLRATATIPIAEPFRLLLLAALPYLPLEPWHNSNMVRDLGKACKRAGVTRVTANDLRRTHGTWLSEAGIDDEHIGKVLRHADGRMARRVYAKLSAEKLGKLLAAKMSATIPQQLTVSAEPHLTENPADSDGSQEGDMRIENPRVGGSIPSRDTSKTAKFQGDSDGEAYRGVAQTDANSRNVRNESATEVTNGRRETEGPRGSNRAPRIAGRAAPAGASASDDGGRCAGGTGYRDDQRDHAPQGQVTPPTGSALSDGEQAGSIAWIPAVSPHPGDPEPTFVYRGPGLGGTGDGHPGGWFGPKPPPETEGDFAWLRGAL